MYEEIIKGILFGAFYGFQASLIGYLKSEELDQSWSVIFKREFWEKFSPTKALKTVLIGTIIGGFTTGKAYLPIEFTSSADWIIFANFFNDVVILGVDQLVKFIVRRTPLVKAWDWLKEKAGILPLRD